MRVLKSDLKHSTLTLKVENDDDLWHLINILERGDNILARTIRTKFIERDGQKIKIGKTPMTLKIELEKFEFNENIFNLRLTGRILEGPEDVQKGSYHTIEIEVGSTLTITKEWRKHHLDRIKKSQLKTPKILLAVVDASEATFGVLDGKGLRIVSELRNHHSMQYEEDKIEEFYLKVASELNTLSEDCKKVILAGPGFAKEHIKKIIEKKYRELNQKIIVDSVSSSTRSGINEILKRGNFEKIIQESEALRETKLVEEFFTHLRKEDGLVTYGFNEVRRADDFGAVDTLLISDQKIKDKEIEKLVDSIEKKGGKIEIISTGHSSGEQFNRIGGIGAFLRFKL
ncbi:MAG: mRNA surveillance protein pelota [Candidatus Aenigmatarchaeota archaeon]